MPIFIDLSLAPAFDEPDGPENEEQDRRHYGDRLKALFGGISEHAVHLRARLQRGEGSISARLGQFRPVVDRADLRQDEVDRHSPGEANDADRP